MYNTETAKEIGYAQFSLPGDFHFFRDTLYLKRNGEFFLYGVGGPASKYAKACGLNEWEGNESIIPLDEEEARFWCEMNLETEDYIQLFGEPEE